MSLYFLIPGDLDSRTGGYGYDRRMIAELRARGWTVHVRRLDDTFPQPSASALAHATQTLADCPDDACVLVDGLAFGAMAAAAERERHRLRLVALVHHPLATETGLTADEAQALEASERRALACARAVIVTSRATVRSLAPYEVAPDRIVVVEPGTDAGPVARGSMSPPHLLCVASVTPRKGYETLMRALSRLRDLDWRLTAIGSLDRAPATARRVREEAARGGIADRVTFLGERGADVVAAAYDTADLFVLPTFHEGYGMVVAEALARGIPVVSTPTGAVAELVGPDGGALVPAADVDALADAVRRFLSEPEVRDAWRAGAGRRRATLPSWAGSAATLSAALDQVR